MVRSTRSSRLADAHLDRRLGADLPEEAGAESSSDESLSYLLNFTVMSVPFCFVTVTLNPVAGSLTPWFGSES